MIVSALGGYEHHDLLHQFDKANDSHRLAKDPSQRISNKCDRRVFFKVVHSSSLNTSFIHTALHKFSVLAPGFKTTFATSVQRNVFRLLYKSNWNYSRSGG